MQTNSDFRVCLEESGRNFKRICELRERVDEIEKKQKNYERTLKQYRNAAISFLLGTRFAFMLYGSLKK